MQAIDRTDTTTVSVTLWVDGREDFVREWRLDERVTVVRGREARKARDGKALPLVQIDAPTKSWQTRGASRHRRPAPPSC